jgi:two-component system chemotaxis response regulator CheY
MHMRRILVVDDSMTMRALYKQVLAHLPLTALTFASDGIEGLECFERVAPHLTFLDINMPRMNGLEMLAELERRAALGRSPIVLVSTEGTEDDLRRGRAAGATEYLRKPFPMGGLRAVVDRLAPQSESVTVPALSQVHGVGRES